MDCLKNNNNLAKRDNYLYMFIFKNLIDDTDESKNNKQ